MAASSSSSTTTSEKKKMIVLLSKEGQTFEVEEATALLSQTVKNMIEDDCTDGGIPLPNVDSKTLAKVIEFCNRHAAPVPPESDADTLKTFDSDYVASIKDDHHMLFDLILAANYLNIKILLDLTCQTVADMIKEKSPEEIRKTFNIKNDLTAEEEQEIKRENAWAFE